MLITRSTLPSGARLVTERMPEVRSASIGFWIGVGSRDEAQDVQGASHLLEHVLFKGTETRSARDIAESFDSVGGEVNAFSAKEYTCFYGRVLGDDLAMATDILIDILCNGSLRPPDFESERRVVLEEIAMRDDAPDDLVHEVFSETLFGSNPLGREVMGTVDSVSGMSVGSLRDFYQENYHGGNLVVAAAGEVDHDWLLASVEPAFAEQRRAVERKPEIPSPASRIKVLNRKTEQAHIILGGLGYSRHHPDRFAWGVLDDLLGGGTASRLFQEIREERGLAYSVYSYRHLYIETGLWAVYAGTSPSNAAEVVKLIIDELERLVENGATVEELDRAKGRSRGSLVLSLEDPASRMSRLGRSELVHGEILSIDELIARVDAVTLEDVARIARDVLHRGNRVLTVIGPVEEDNFEGWL
ncbi:MAG: M16 family metallopeptidase [Actinomycetota bacterium]